MLHLITAPLLAAARRLRNRGGVIINGHTLTRSQMGLQLEVLGRWFDFISLEELPDRQRSPAKRPFCLLTFDDGKRNHLTEIAPELERRRVPAVFYVTTEPLSTGTWFWFDRRAELVKRLGRCPKELELAELKRLPFNRLTERLDRLGTLRNSPHGDGPEEYQPLTWAEVRDLARRGFHIGAHGFTHAILTNETPARARAEIEESLARVGAELGTRCTSFAFPNGNYTPQLAQHARHCGATTIMTTEPMWVQEHSPRWRLPRIQLSGGFTRTRIELKLALASVRGILTNPDGTGRKYARTATDPWTAEASSDFAGVEVTRL